MTKKIFIFLCTVFMILSVSLTVFAGDGDEFYEEYDNYDEFEQDFDKSVGMPMGPVQEDGEWYNSLSPIPPVIGLVAGTATVLILFRKHNAARRQMPEHPHFHTPKINHTVISDSNDNTL